METELSYGHAHIEPKEAKAGQHGTWQIIYTVGQVGMALEVA